METKEESQRWKRWLGVALFILSFVFYGCLLLVPFLPLSLEDKTTLSVLLVISGESSFWLSAIILGKEMIEKFRTRKWRSWIERQRKSAQEHQTGEPMDDGSIEK